MMEIIAHNMAPIMFASLVAFLLLGYPVAFALAANGLLFFIIGVELAPLVVKDKGLKVGVGKFPWAASGRAIGIGRTEGFTKLIFDEETHRIIGGAIVGVHAGDLLAEIGLAIEMGAEAEDIGHTIHPHPTLGESVAMAAEVYDGTITDLYMPKKK